MTFVPHCSSAIRHYWRARQAMLKKQGLLSFFHSLLANQG
jgi:hypothetical protein